MQGPASAAYITPLTIRHLLDANVVSASKQEIVYRDRRRLTYTDLRERIARLANLLTRFGVGYGTTVAVMDWDSHRYLECYFSVPMLGAVLQTVNIRLSPEQILYTLTHAGAEVLILHRDFHELFETFRGRLPSVRTVIMIADDEPLVVPAWAAGEYEELIAEEGPDFEFQDFDENAVATTFYTTGTTGSPKAVCFTHRQLVLHTLAFNAPFGVTRSRGFGLDDVYMPLTPMFHVHAWGFPYIATMLGVKQVYPGRYDPDLILDLREREGVSFSHCVPTVLQMILSAAARRDGSLDDWLMIIGGAALSPELATVARARGCALLGGYGMSETGPGISIGRPPKGDNFYDDQDATIRSGVPIPLVSVRIVDANGRDCPADDRSQGELLLRSPWLTPAYPGEETASRELWAGGWLHTQDVATMAPDGSIQIRDRLKDVIKSGGEWICSLALENLILSMPEVADIAVVGVPDPKWQERPAGLVVAAVGASPSLESINATLSRAAAAGSVSRWATLQRIEFADALPRTSVGKVDKKAVRALLAAA